MKVLLVGNPNVGKSVVFTRLTGIHVISSNYPGTTINYTSGFTKINNEKVEIIDVPGTYSLKPSSKAEKVAVELLKDGDIIINIIDATNLERNLCLTMELLKLGKPMMIALNMWDDTHHRGITIDAENLQKILKIPVVPTIAVSGFGIKELSDLVFKLSPPDIKKISETNKWKKIGIIINNCQKLKHKHHTFIDILSDASVKPITGLPIAALVIFLMFKIIRIIGESIIGYVMDPLFNNFYMPLITKLGAILNKTGFLHNILIGKLIEGEIDLIQSFGVLTTGIYVPVAMVIPYIISFYLLLGIIEDMGYIPRLAVLLDSLMHKIGLHGYSIIPTLLGLGCNVPGILGTRILESKRERLIAAAGISIGVPCTALQAMIIGLLAKYGFKYIALVYFSLFIIWIIISFTLNLLLKGFSPELLIEIPHYRLPLIQTVLKKLYIRVKEFIVDAIPIMLAGVFIVNILYYFKVFDIIANISSPVLKRLWGLPKETIVAITVGFLRKDTAVAMLIPLNLSPGQLVKVTVILSIFFPCIATFNILLKEFGLKDMLKIVSIMIIVTIITGCILNLII